MFQIDLVSLYNAQIFQICHINITLNTACIFEKHVYSNDGYCDDFT